MPDCPIHNSEKVYSVTHQETYDPPDNLRTENPEGLIIGEEMTQV